MTAPAALRREDRGPAPGIPRRLGAPGGERDAAEERGQQERAERASRGHFVGLAT
jgi:hypothetical protein